MPYQIGSVIEWVLADLPEDTTEVITCMDFDNGFSALKGIYVDSREVVIKKGTAYFNGVSATLEVSAFSNTYRYE